MDVKLRGFNVDTLHSSVVTPEPLVAAYARISRSKDRLDKLHKDAADDLDKTRKFVKRIVFQLGHESVAEHAVFNFDIENISRIAVEDLERHRLAGYTERSQRWVEFTKSTDESTEEFYVPMSRGNASQVFKVFVEERFKDYHTILQALQSAGNKNAKEDARYVTPLAMHASLGMVVNARQLRYMLKCLVASSLDESRELASRLLTCVQEVAPSLFDDCRCTPFQSLHSRVIKRDCKRDCTCATGVAVHQGVCDVELCYANMSDYDVLSALRFEVGCDTYRDCRTHLVHLNTHGIGDLWMQLYNKMGVEDVLTRAWELPDFTYEVLCSASAYAQLKRHRMLTMIPQNYNVELGVTIPESIRQDDEAYACFLNAVESANKTHALLEQQVHAKAAQYALLQAHRRRVLIKINARELVAFSRLRQDRHAQWDIRAIADRMVAEAKKRVPFTMAIAGGKDSIKAAIKAAGESGRKNWWVHI